MKKVAIVGRTNVGKSTLFNALVRRRVAIVEDEEKVTRDALSLFVTLGHSGKKRKEGRKSSSYDWKLLESEAQRELEEEMRLSEERKPGREETRRFLLDDRSEEVLEDDDSFDEDEWDIDESKSFEEQQFTDDDALYDAFEKGLDYNSVKGVFRRESPDFATLEALSAEDLTATSGFIDDGYNSDRGNSDERENEARDYQDGRVRDGSVTFILTDTGGIVDEHDGVLDHLVAKQVDLAILDSDLIIAVFDGQHGVHPLDKEIVQKLKRTEVPVLWVINKCEKDSTRLNSVEFYNLGIPEFIQVSSAHRFGMRELEAQILETLSSVGDKERENPSDGAIKVALVGKPNTGKSSLVNRLLGNENTVIVSEIAGTTRDTTIHQLKREGRNLTLYDTAGLRKKSRVESNTVERFSTLRTLQTVNEADVVILVLDASNEMLAQQDIKVANLVAARGKPLMIVINKWDLVEKDHRTVKAIENYIRKEVPTVSYAPLIFVSAKTGRRCPNIIDEIFTAYAESQVRLKTSEVNKVFTKAFVKSPPPAYHGTPVKVAFATQIQTNPPTFVCFLNRLGKFRDSYRRYLEKEIRQSYKFRANPIRLIFKRKTQPNEAKKNVISLL